MAVDVERTVGGKIFRLEEHVDRLYKSLSCVRIDPGLTPQEMHDLTEEGIRRNQHLLPQVGEFRITPNRLPRVGGPESLVASLASSLARRRARRRRWQGEYHEAKGFRFYLVDDERIEQLISWHQMGNEQAFGAALRQVKEAGLIPEDQVRLCAIGDGAAWIWKWVEELFPSARQILDYYHGSSYLHAVAEAQYGADAGRASHWLEATLARLFCDEGAGVVWGLQRMQPVSEEAGEAIGTALTYLQKRLHQVDFGSHRKGGYPIGSPACCRQASRSNRRIASSAMFV